MPSEMNQQAEGQAAAQAAAQAAPQGTAQAAPQVTPPADVKQADTVNPFSTPPEVRPKEPGEGDTTGDDQQKAEPDQGKEGIFKKLARTLFGSEDVSEDAIAAAEELKRRAERDAHIEEQIALEEQAKLAQNAEYQREQYLADIYRQTYEATKDPYQAQARVDLIKQQMFEQDTQRMVQQQIDAALQARNAQAGLATRRPELAPLSNVIADLGRTYGQRLPPHMQPKSAEEQIALGERFVMELVRTVGGVPAGQQQAPANAGPSPWARAQTETGSPSAAMEHTDEDIEKMAAEMAKQNFGGF
jgi:hypothetical protein